jgi:hypothetical protein
MTKLGVAFRNFANAPETAEYGNDVVRVLLGAFHSGEKRLFSSRCPPLSARIPVGDFPLNLILGTFMKICRETPNLFKTGEKYRCLT